MNVIWSQEACENLITIEEFIARDSLERAVRFVTAIIDHADTMLSDNLKSGRTVPEIGSSDFRELIYRGYRVVYRLDGDQIEILTVFEGHRLLQFNESDN